MADTEHHDRGRRFGRTALSWPRLQWLKLVAVVQDHPAWATAAILGLAGAITFYGTALGGFPHVRAAFRVWHLRAFGGVQELDRASQVFEIIGAFDSPRYDRLDIASLSLHVTGSAFRQELVELVRDEGGRVRIVTLDPRIADPGDPARPAFETLARKFGQEPWELEVECWHSISKLLSLRRELGGNFEIRLIREPSPAASDGYFLIGRSYHLYDSDAPDARFDVIVPRPDPGSPADGRDSPAHPALRVVDRPDEPEVRRFTGEFERLWASALPVDDALAAALLERFEGPATATVPAPADQP